MARGPRRRRRTGAPKRKPYRLTTITSHAAPPRPTGHPPPTVPPYPPRVPQVSQQFDKFWRGLWAFAAVGIPAAVVNSGLKYMQKQIELAFQQRLTTFLHAQYCRCVPGWAGWRGLANTHACCGLVVLRQFPWRVKIHTSTRLTPNHKFSHKKYVLTIRYYSDMLFAYRPAATAPCSNRTIHPWFSTIAPALQQPRLLRRLHAGRPDARRPAHHGGRGEVCGQHLRAVQPHLQGGRICCKWYRKGTICLGWRRPAAALQGRTTTLSLHAPCTSPRQNTGM